MVIEQAMGLPLTLAATAKAMLAHFVEHAKASGDVAQSLARHNLYGAIAAPATGSSQADRLSSTALAQH